MATKTLHVSNLSWNTTEDDLLDAFSERYEAERALVMRDANTGQSRKYGFIFYDSPEGAAITQKYLDNTEINGRRIKVTYAPERQRR